MLRKLLRQENGFLIKKRVFHFSTLIMHALEGNFGIEGLSHKFCKIIFCDFKILTFNI